MSHNPVVSFTGGSATKQVAAGAGTVVVFGKNTRLCRVVVISAGTSGAVTFYDNASAASGTILGVVPGTAAVGSVFEFQMPAQFGIVASAAASSVGCTVCYV